MTRIYFKPQSSTARNARNRKQIGKGFQPLSEEDGQGGWRTKLDPNAIEEIANGLEKMVLSWTNHQEDGVQDGGSPAQNTDALHSREVPDNGDITLDWRMAREDEIREASQLSELTPSTEMSLLVAKHNRPVSVMEPAVEEIIRGELIKNCHGTVTAGEPVAEPAIVDSSSNYWFLTPGISLPNCTLKSAEEEDKSPIRDGIQEESAVVYGQTIPLENGSSKASMFEVRHQERASRPVKITSLLQRDRGRRKGARIRSMDEESDSDCNFKEKNNGIPEKISYHIRSNGSQNWTETIEINGGDRINDLLGKRLASLSNHASPFPLLKGKEESSEMYKKKVEELQIALLECAMEYEVKIVEMKMKMLHMKSENRQKETGDNSSAKPGYENTVEEMDVFSARSHQEREGQRVEYLRKQLCRLQREKLALSRELNDLRKRERQFDLQRRSLDDALNRVNSLQRELGRREQEIVDCQLREKEVKAQLYEVQLALQKAQASQIEPRRLLSLLPALREWLQTIKKGQLCEATTNFFEAQHEKTTPRSMNPPAPPAVDSIVCSVTKEIQALQKALSKLASKK